MLHYGNSETEQEIQMVRDILDKDFFIKLMEEEQPDKVFFAGHHNLEAALRKAEP